MGVVGLTGIGGMVAEYSLHLSPELSEGTPGKPNRIAPNAVLLTHLPAQAQPRTPNLHPMRSFVLRIHHLMYSSSLSTAVIGR